MKKLLLVVIALSAFVIMWQLVDLATYPSIAAETVPQMRLRLFAEAKDRHPDVWDGCNAQCVTERVNQAPIVFAGMAKQSNSTIEDVAKYSIVRDYEWGLSFASDYKRAPNQYDWALSYVARMATIQKELAFAPALFVRVNEETNEYKFKRFEYAE